ncbi:hypothetical protein YC2023_104962 [Brassica napus]
MKLFFYHRKVMLFSIELDPSNTVLEMKQKIEKTKRISVSNQTIFFKGKILLADRDSLTLTQCKIFNKSRLELYFCRSRLRHDLRRALQQKEQPPAPASTSVKDVIIIEDSPEKNQDSSLVLHQTEKPLVPTPSCSVDALSALEEWLMATEENDSVQEPSWRYDNYQDWLPRESSSSTSNIFEDEAFFPLSRYNISLMLEQMQQSPAPASTSDKDVTNIEDSPEKNQDSNVMDKSNDDQDQVLHQLERSLVPSWSIDEVFGTQEWPAATEGNVSVQEPSWRNNNVRQEDWLQRESSSSTSNIFGDFLFDEDNNQMLQPTEQSLAQSTSVQASLGEYQDWSAVERSIFFQMLDQPEQSLAGSAMARQDKNQDVFQSGPSSTSNTFGEDLPLPTELFSNTQSHWPASTTQEHRISDQYLPVSQVVQTQTPTRSIRHVINIPDSPESSRNKRAKNLLTVMVLSFPVNDTPAMKFPVEVNPSENVEVLRTELAKMQQWSQLLLPEGGYFFIHKTHILYEKQSFRWNRVAQGDTIEIFPGSVTR